MNCRTFDTLTRDRRLDEMHTGIISDYQLRDGEWGERFRIETTRALADGVAVRPRGDQQDLFNKRTCSRNGRHRSRAAGKRDGGPVKAQPSERKVQR